MSQDWRPLSKRESAQDERFGKLHEGFPDWIRPALTDWLQSIFLVRETLAPHGSRFRWDLFSQVQLHLRQDLQRHRMLVNDFGVCSNLTRSMLDEPSFGLDVFDFLVGRACLDPVKIEALDNILRIGGSVWMVRRSEEGFYFCRRVSDEVQAAVELVATKSQKAGRHLQAAMQHLYGRAPNSSAAYREAIKAVEAVACPVVLPKNPQATLGTVITALKDAPAGKFEIALKPPASVNGVEKVAALCELIWKGQHDRHGIADESAPMSVTLPEAEMAFHGAVTLVHWFGQGLITLAKP